MRVRIATALIAVLLIGVFVARSLAQVSLGIYAAAAPTATATPTSTPTPGTVVQPYYLAGIGQTSGYRLPISGTYGQVGLAGRVGWRWLQPKNTGAFDWTVIDDFQTAAHNANALWSISVSAGAYTPLWLFQDTTTNPTEGCAATPVTGEDGPRAAGTLQAFQIAWNVSYVYTPGSVQCIPIPWDTAYQTAFQTMINALAAHVGPFGKIATDSLLDHVVFTGVNSYTQENWLPFCTSYNHSGSTSSYCGATVNGSNVSDVQQWINDIAAIPATCTGNSLALCSGFDDATAIDYATRIQSAYTTIAGYWATAFPTKKYASMYVDSASTPFNSYPSVTGLKFLNHTASLYPSTSYLMSNAVTGSSPYIPNKITCYTVGHTGCQPPPTGFTQPSATIAGQEGTAITSGSPPSCSNTTAFANMMSAALTDQAKFMEIYDQDIKCLP